MKLHLTHATLDESIRAGYAAIVQGRSRAVVCRVAKAEREDRHRVNVRIYDGRAICERTRRG